ncbi:MAG: CBS domain-containing protein, partial [Actinobacteria bacterium]|nr:CBS domain-containing protein [Actinomycetota bacterium]
MEEKLVKDVMTEKVITVGRDTSVRELSKILLKNNITGAPVVDSQGTLLGMVTDADIITEDIEPVFPLYFDPLIVSYAFIENFEKYKKNIDDYLNIKVEEIMTRRVKTLKKDTTVSDAVRMLVKYRINRIPVIDDKNTVIGIVARADILKSMLSD